MYLKAGGQAPFGRIVEVSKSIPTAKASIATRAITILVQVHKSIGSLAIGSSLKGITLGICS
jgi:hypothetical protein